MSDSLVISDLSVTVRGKTILDFDRTVEIQRGDVVAVVGANGAGKTTLVNCIIGQMPYTGTISKGPGFHDIGILFQDNKYSDLIKVKEFLSLVVQKSLKDPSVLRIIRDFNLEGILNSRIGKLSHGEIQRFSLALVLYCDSDFLIFDELTTGLDFEKRMHLLHLVREQTRSKTVLVVTHYFEEITNWANKILMIDKGHVVFWGTIDEFKDRYRHHGVVLVSYDDAAVLLRDADFSDVVCIEHYEDALCALVIESEAKLKSVEQFLSEHELASTFRPSDFYSMYRYAQKRGEHRA